MGRRCLLGFTAHLSPENSGPPCSIMASMPLEGWGQEPSTLLNLTPWPHLSESTLGLRPLAAPHQGLLFAQTGLMTLLT